MSIASGAVYDLAVRGVLADMRQFDNFKEVAGRFPPGMLIPGVSGNGLYAIPKLLTSGYSIIARISLIQWV